MLFLPGFTLDFTLGLFFSKLFSNKLLMSRQHRTLPGGGNKKIKNKKLKIIEIHILKLAQTNTNSINKATAATLPEDHH